MTWIDIALILFFVIFLAVGARLGSLWTGACLIGGFFGAFLVEYYELPLAEMMGNFHGAHLVASALLFAGGVAAALLPGWILSRLTAAVFLGIFDSVFGLLTGLLAGFIAVTLAFLWILPRVPSVERSAAWKQSRFARPMHHAIEDFFSDSHFQKPSSMDQIKKDFMEDVTPALQKTEEKIKDSAKKLTKRGK